MSLVSKLARQIPQHRDRAVRQALPRTVQQRKRFGYQRRQGIGGTMHFVRRHLVRIRQPLGTINVHMNTCHVMKCSEKH